MAGKQQHVAIFTTASLPWMTGTAVNPLFRAAYLAKAGNWDVTLVVPWLSKADQILVYPNKMKFNSPAEQEAYVRRWLEERIGLLPRFDIKFYPGKVIRLSAATQDVPRSVICNVHGVNPKFIEIGKLKHQQLCHKEQAFFKGAYYIGKMVWSKGYTELLQLLHNHQTELSGLKMELYGSGEDSDEVKASAKRLSLDIRVYPGRDHGDSIFHDYKVFINPSTTDVVCTTTAEALAMGKIVICANHPSNEFFKRFPNCHMYNTEKEFVRLTMKALGQEPIPLSDELRHELSWEAATERFVRVADIAPTKSAGQQAPSSQHFMRISPEELQKNMEEASAYFHNTISGIETARCVFGAIPNTLQPDEQQCKELGWNLRG
ncbi:unnamed protein product [Urochloa humidicola]